MMKTPQKMTKTLIKMYNDKVYKKFGITIRVMTQKDFNKLRCLAYIADIIDEKAIKQTYSDIFDEYSVMITNKSNNYVKEKTLPKWSIWFEDMYQAWYEYAYNAVFSWGNAENIASLDRITATALKKLLRYLQNDTIEMVRTEAVNEQNYIETTPEKVIIKNKPLTRHLEFIWQSKEDAKVCSICNELDGKVLSDIPDKSPHLNCRCNYGVKEWYTDDDGHTIYGFQYDIEQNKEALSGKKFERSFVKTRQFGPDYDETILVDKIARTKKVLYKYLKNVPNLENIKANEDNLTDVIFERKKYKTSMTPLSTEMCASLRKVYRGDSAISLTQMKQYISQQLTGEHFSNQTQHGYGLNVSPDKQLAKNNAGTYPVQNVSEYYILPHTQIIKAKDLDDIAANDDTKSYIAPILKQNRNAYAAALGYDAIEFDDGTISILNRRCLGYNNDNDIFANIVDLRR